MFSKCLPNWNQNRINFLFLFCFHNRRTAESEHVVDPQGEPWTVIEVEFYFFNILPSLSIALPLLVTFSHPSPLSPHSRVEF